MATDSQLLPGATQAAALLRAMGHAGRLEILCLLDEGELTMSDIALRLALRRPAVSQQLAVLRGEGLITRRRSGKNIIYSVVDDLARAIIGMLRHRALERAFQQKQRANPSDRR